MTPKANNVSELSTAILSFLSQKEIDGADKVVALKTAAFILETIRAEEFNAQCQAAVIQQTFGHKK